VYVPGAHAIKTSLQSPAHKGLQISPFKKWSRGNVIASSSSSSQSSLFLALITCGVIIFNSVGAAAVRLFLFFSISGRIFLSGLWPIHRRVKGSEDFHAMMSDTFPVPPLRESRIIMSRGIYNTARQGYMACFCAAAAVGDDDWRFGRKLHIVYNVSHRTNGSHRRALRASVFFKAAARSIHVCELTRRWDIFLHRRLLDGKGSHESAAQAKISDRNLVIGSPGSPRRNIYSNMQLTPAGVHKFKAIISLSSFYPFNFLNKISHCNATMKSQMISSQLLELRGNFLPPVIASKKSLNKKGRFLYAQLALLYVFSHQSNENSIYSIIVT